MSCEVFFRNSALHSALWVRGLFWIFSISRHSARSGSFAAASVEGYAGWILGAYQNFDRNLEIAYAICTAAYMTIPFTETIPVATILVLVARFFEGPPARTQSSTVYRFDG